MKKDYLTTTVEFQSTKIELIIGRENTKDIIAAFKQGMEGGAE